MMTALLAAAFFSIGLILTMRGGDIFVDKAALLAEASGIPRFVVGATLVSLCTTTPELMVSILATLQGSTDLAVGNAVGSAACNSGLILGVSALLLPAIFPAKEAKTKGTLMIFLTILLGCFAVDGIINAGESLGLLAILFAFFAMNLQSTAQNMEQEHRVTLCPAERVKTILWFLLGGMAVILGAKLMVDHGVILARMFHVPESMIGLTLVALGTSLPELMTAFAAIRRKQATLAAGNIIGANIIDLALVLPTCAAVGGGILPVGSDVFLRDLPFTVVLMAIAMIPPMFYGRLRRMQGLALLVVYGIYLTCLAGS